MVIRTDQEKVSILYHVGIPIVYNLILGMLFLYS
jgi:hypothetical protein